MGLDMYLTGKRYIGTDEEHSVIAKRIGDIPSEFKVKEIVIELGYWRKANAIHQWFVENVQGGIDECQKSYIELDQLKELYGIICDILDNNQRASELLPTQEGFFFGSVEYDEYYFSDLKETKEILERIFDSKLNELGYNIYYHSSW